MIRFAEAFPDEKIVSALRRQFTSTHFKRLIYLDDPLKRKFYVQICRTGKWTTRTLDKKINSMLFERTALSKKPDKLIARELKALREEDKLTQDPVYRLLIGIRSNQEP
jgi:predicted nuclease of restriction endonuclease-like (RecB) superfamily